MLTIGYIHKYVKRTPEWAYTIQYLQDIYLSISSEENNHKRPSKNYMYKIVCANYL